MGGNGDYGLDTFSFDNTLTRDKTSVPQSLIAAVNDTNYYQGYLGLGVVSGKFGDKSTTPFIPQMAGTDGYIPSLTYGYTAGAYYRDGELTHPRIHLTRVWVPCPLTPSQTVKAKAATVPSHL